MNARRLAALLLLLTTLSARKTSAGPAPARQAQRRVGVNFQVEREAVPDYLCVVTNDVRADSASATELTSPRGDLARLKEWTTAIRERQFVADAKKLACGTAGDTDPGPIETDQVAAPGKAAPQSKPKPGAVIRDALCALAGVNATIAGSRCHATEQPNPCQPTIEIHASTVTSIMCTANTQPKAVAPNARPRVAVLQVIATQEPTPPKLANISLHGDAAVLLLEFASEQAVTIAEAGGSYLSGPSRVSTGPDQQLVLPLLQRCGTHRLILPNNEGTPPFCASFFGTKAVAAGGTPAPDLTLTLTTKSASSVELPYSLDSGTRRLDVSEVPVHSESPVDAVYEWETARPPADIPMRLRGLAVNWTNHCMHPWPACPELRLPDTGATCSVPQMLDGKCAYKCTTSGSFSLPARATFTTQPTPSCDPTDKTSSERVENWEDTVISAGQTLTSYVPERDRHLLVDLSSWQTMAQKKGEKLVEFVGRSGEKISYVEVRTPYGATFRLKPETAQDWLRVPDLGCGDVLAYRPSGELSYEEEPRKVETGKLILKPPAELLSSPLALGFALGGGEIMAPAGFNENTKDRPTGVVEGIMLYRLGPRWLSTWPAALRPDLELRGGAELSQHWFESLNARGGVAETVWYLHIPIELNLVSHWLLGWIDPFYATLGPGIDIGTPIYKADQRKAPIQAAFMFDFSGGYRLARSTSVEVGARVVPYERFFSYDFSPAGQPTASVRTATLFEWALKLRFNE